MLQKWLKTKWMAKQAETVGCHTNLHLFANACEVIKIIPYKPPSSPKKIKQKDRDK